MGKAIDTVKQTLRPYPEMKPSGIEWLGEIPSHWDVNRIKWSITACKNGVWGEEPEGEDDLPCIRVADFDRETFRVGTDKLTLRKISSKERQGRLLSKGDLLIEKSGGGEQQLVGAVVYFDHPFDAVTSNFVARMPVAEGMDGRFLVYVHAHLYSGRVNYRSIKQTTGIQNLDSQQYLDERIAYPPLPEQEAIARFLDHKTAQIDALIGKKETLLARLADKRTALISRAVTKGLDPSAPMRDSGIEWLGRVPAAWEVCHVKRVANVSYGMGGEIDRGLTEGTNLLSLPNVTKDGILLTDEVPLCDLDEASKDDLLLKKGDLLFNWRNGSSNHLGKTAYFDRDGEWTHVSFLLRLRFDLTSCDSRYFQYMLNGLRLTGFFSSSKAGVNNTFNLNELANLRITKPPLDEQRAIAQYLHKELSHIDRQALQSQQTIDKLKEYRTALITHAVTGKIDVRGWVGEEA